jgi:hypothetical protein
MKKELRKSLLEIKRKKENLIAEEKIVYSRVKFIMEMNAKNYKNLSSREKTKVFEEVIIELRELKNEGLISEQFDLWGTLKGLFGGTLETGAEALVDGMLTKLGFKSDGFLKKFMVSYMTSRPGDLIKSFVDCRTFTKLVSESLIEAYVMNLQDKKNVDSFIFDILRNTIGDSLKNTNVLSELENKLGDKICSLFNIFGERAKQVSDKLSGSVGTTQV